MSRREGQNRLVMFKDQLRQFVKGTRAEPTMRLEVIFNRCSPGLQPVCRLHDGARQYVGNVVVLYIVKKEGQGGMLKEERMVISRGGG